MSESNRDETVVVKSTEEIITTTTTINKSFTTTENKPTTTIENNSSTPNEDNLTTTTGNKSLTEDNEEQKKSPNVIPNQNVTPKNPSPSENETVPSKNETAPSQNVNETPEKSTPPRIKYFSSSVDSSPMPNTKNLVDKWEIIKQENENLAKATQYEIERKYSTPRKISNITPISNFLSPETNRKSSISYDETKMKDRIPAITKKFSMKDKRLRETIKTFNNSYNTANIDFKDTEKNIITVKPIIKEKRIYMEDEDDNDKVQRSKRVKVSELRGNDNTSLWHKVNSSLRSLKDIFKFNSTVEEENEEENEEEKENTIINKKVNPNESVIITPTVKHQEVKEPVRLNEATCLNIFNPTANKSTIPMFLRIRRRTSHSEEKSNPLVKSNTKLEWVNKLYMVISNENSIPKLFDVPVHWTSLSSQMVFILDLAGEALIQFNGSNSLDGDKDYAQRICKRISLNDNVPDIFEINQKESYSQKTVPLKLFWKALELDQYTDSEREQIINKNDKLNLNNILEKNKKQIDIEKAIYVYRINEQTHSLDLIHNGTFPTYRCLNSNVSMIFDFVGEVYLWQGKSSSLNARSKGIKFAQKIYTDYPRPTWASLRKINEGHEPILFQEKFKDSYLFF